MNDATSGTSGPVTTTNRAALLALGTRLQSMLAWPGLAAFLDATALGESGWQFRPYGRVPTPGSNAAVGPYQLRPRSAGDTEQLRARFEADPTLVERPDVATAAIVAYASRVLHANPRATWGELRASLAFPVFVHGRPSSVPASLQKRFTLPEWQDRFDDTQRRFAKNLARIGSPGSMAAARAWSAPRRLGVLEVLAMLGGAL